MLYCRCQNKIAKNGEQKLFVAPYDKTHLAMKRLQCFIAYHRKEFTEKKINFPRTSYAHEQYKKFILEGCRDFVARKKVSKFLGHHRDDATRIYLPDGDERKLSHRIYCDFETI